MSADTSHKRFSFVVDRFDVDWFVPLLACHQLGNDIAGLVVAGSFLLASACLSRKATIDIDASGQASYSVTPLWRRGHGADTTRVDGAKLMHWSTSFCRGIELRGPQHSLTAATRHRLDLARPEVSMERVAAPPLRLRCRPLLLNAPNMLVLCGSLLAVRNTAGLLTVMTMLLGAVGIASSLTASLRGAPALERRLRSEDSSRCKGI